MAAYLIEGGSGAGKTSVAEELERRGYAVVHGDRSLAYYGDPETGVPVSAPPCDDAAERVRWGYDRWIWPVDEVRRLIAAHRDGMVFFCGHSANADRFIDLFDAVFVLTVDDATLDRRLAVRPGDEFGGRPVERALVLHLNRTGAGLPRSGVEIDATAPVGQVVDAILARLRAGE